VSLCIWETIESSTVLENSTRVSGLGLSSMSPRKKHDSHKLVASQILIINLNNQSKPHRPNLVTMKLIWSAWAIAIGTICVPRIDASSYKDDHPPRKLEYEKGLKGGGFKKTKMLRNERAHSSDQSRIIGGQEADIGEYPFFVEWGGCGASLVHKGKLNQSYTQEVRICRSAFSMILTVRA
jgi:hypothetical protein